MPPPRGLVLLAALWILGSWLICIGPQAPLHPTIAGFTPGIRLMVASLGVGLCAAWPLLRLSGPRERWPVRRTVLDLLTITTLAQVVLWPLRLTTAWSPSRLAMIDALMIAWSVVVAAFVAAALASGAARARTRAMLVCLGITGLGLPLEIACRSAGLPEPPAWALGPVLGPLSLTIPDASMRLDEAWVGLGIVLSFATLAWVRTWRVVRPRAPVAPCPADR
jgi:hypothetical protein